MESPQTTISCGRFFQHPYSESVGLRRVSAHVPSYGSIGDQPSVPKPNLTGKLLILRRMKAMAIAGPFQNLSNHFKTNDVLSGAKRTRARSSAVSRQVRAGKRRVRTGLSHLGDRVTVRLLQTGVFLSDDSPNSALSAK